MIVGRTNAFAQPNICNEAQIPIRGAQRSVLRFQQNLYQSHHVPGHLAPMVATSSASLAAEPYVNDAIEDQEVTDEMIVQEFGKPVAGIVMEVADDKALRKDERKRRQVENAGKKSHKAKLIKLADKTSNLRAIASSPAVDWSIERRLEYIEWAKGVVAGLRGTSLWLEQKFDEATERPCGRSRYFLIHRLPQRVFAISTVYICLHQRIVLLRPRAYAKL